ncbi:MAG: complex I subunit 1 family protein [bacterium]
MNPYIAYLVFPGFVFTAIVGMLASWIDRKVTARVQWRVGPPLLQPLYDFVKLLGKETVIPRGCSKVTFLLAPLFGLMAVTLVSTLVWSAILWPAKGFVGDLIVVIYFLIFPMLAVIIGGFASRNPIASLGASREMKLMLADELPFILAVFVSVIQAGGALRLGQFVTYQQTYGWVFGSISGVLATVVAIITMQAKLTLIPFDIPEAETEIMSGPYVEYSGPPLAIFKLTRMMMLFTLPMVLVLLFLGGMDFHGWSILWSILKYVVLLVLIILIRNTNPRVRIDQAMKFLWGPVTFIGIVAVVLAFLGL